MNERGTVVVPPASASEELVSDGSVRVRRGGLPLVLSLAASVAVGSMSAPAPLAAHEFVVGELVVDHPNAPPTPPGVASAAGYMIITNNGTEEERLLGGSAGFADEVEMHRTSVEGDVARMRELTDGLVIGAGERVELAPGGTHLMFVGLDGALAEGERLDATLRFARAGTLDVVFAVERHGSGAEPARHDEMDHGEVIHDGTGHESMEHDATGHGESGHVDTDRDGRDGGT